MSFCKDIYPELIPHLELLKGTETEFDDTVGVTRFMLRGKPYCELIADGTDDAALIIVSGQGENDTSLLMHGDMSERVSGNKCTVRVLLTGSVPYELVRDLCGHAYNMVLRHFPKKVQHELLEDIWQ
jgi:hypothetical protein